MANPLYGSNKDDDVLNALCDALQGGVTTGDPGEEDSYVTITIGGAAYKLHLTAV